MPDKKKAQKKTPGFLPKHMQEAVVDCVGTLLDAASDEGDDVDAIRDYADSDEGNIADCLGYVRACSDLRGKKSDVIAYIREVAEANNMKIPEESDG
jgi:hypothetical protein